MMFLTGLVLCFMAFILCQPVKYCMSVMSNWDEVYFEIIQGWLGVFSNHLEIEP